MITRVLASLPFTALTLFGLLCAFLGIWEQLAIITRRVPTISATTAAAYGSMPGWGKVSILLLVGVLVGALTTHFTGWLALPGTKV